MDNRTSALISSSKLISTDSNWLISVLNLLRCSVTLSLSTILKLNNFFIEKILFEAEDFSYIFDSVIIKSLVVFSLETLNEIVDIRVNRITPRAF